MSKLSDLCLHEQMRAFNPIRQAQRPTAQIFNHLDLKFLAVSGSRPANSQKIEDEPTWPSGRVTGKGISIRSIVWRAGLIRHISDHIRIAERAEKIHIRI